MKKQMWLGAIFTTFLTACGGGGSGASTSPTTSAPPPNPPASNSPPDIGVSSTQLTLEERQQARITLSISDPDDDKVTVEVTTTEYLDAEYEEAANTITISSLEVDENTQQTLTVTAEDDVGLRSQVVVTVRVTNKPSAPPQMAWRLDTDKPKRQVIELGSLTLPFSVTDEDTPLEELIFSARFSMLQGQGLPPSLDVNINPEEGVLVISAGPLDRGITNTFQGYLEVTDGENMIDIPFELSVAKAPVVTNIRVPDMIMQAGETIVQPIRISARDRVNLQILDVFYADENDAVENPLNTFEFDLSQDVFTASANLNTAGRTVRLGVRSTETGVGSSEITNFFNIRIRAPFTESEQLLKAKLDTFLTEVQFSEEYEFIARYAVQRQFLLGMINDIEYQEALTQISDIRAVNRGLAILRHELFVQQLATTEDFVDPTKANIAIQQLEDTLDNLSVFRDSIAPVANQQLAQLNIPVTLGSEPVIKGLPNQLQSRFIGNLRYGSWNESNKWHFHSDYQFMRGPVALTMGTTNF